MDASKANTALEGKHECTFLRREGWPLLQDPAKVDATGLVNFVAAVAYHICQALPAAFTQPGLSLLAQPCTH